MEGGKKDANAFFCVIAVILILLVIYYWFYISQCEHLGTPFFLDQMAMAYTDPTWFNFLGYERDVSGMSERDYYLENQMNASTSVGPQYFEGKLQFEDHTGYMDMPIKYRPLRKTSASAAQLQSEIRSNNMEEYAYADLNQAGHY